MTRVSAGDLVAIVGPGSIGLLCLQVVMAEVADLVRNGKIPETVPFFRNDDEESLFLRLGAGGAGLKDPDPKQQTS